MSIHVSQHKINNREAVVIVKYGAVTACSLQLLEDVDLELLTSKIKNTLKETKHEKQKLIMVLMEAKDEAKKVSSKNKNKKVFINVDSEGECSLVNDQDEDSIHAFVNGAEIPLPSLALSKEKIKQVKKQNKQKPIKVMATKEKAKKSAKKAAKKSSTKKTAKASSNGKEEKIPRGNNMYLTAIEWKKVDAVLEREEKTFSAWSRELVRSKIK